MAMVWKVLGVTALLGVCVVLMATGLVDRAEGTAPLRAVATEESSIEATEHDELDPATDGIVTLPKGRLLAAAVAQEQAVLSKALADMDGWISELPVGSPWRRAFSTARAEIVSVLEPPPEGEQRT